MYESILEIMNTPYLWQSLGLVTSMSMFVSPILYNGDWKNATKSLVILGVYAFFVAILEYSYLGIKEGHDINMWIKPITILVLVGLSYALGLFIGVYTFNKIEKKILSK